MRDVRRVIGVDESGSLTDHYEGLHGSVHNGHCVIAAAYSDNVKLGHRGHKEKLRGHVYEDDLPDVSVAYLILDYPLLADAREIYRHEPRSRVEQSWNGKFEEFMLRRDATVHLLRQLKFDPENDRVYVDSFCRSVVLRNRISQRFQQVTGLEVPHRSINCGNGSDTCYEIVWDAGTWAKFLSERYKALKADIPTSMLIESVPFSANDLADMSRSPAYIEPTSA